MNRTGDHQLLLGEWACLGILYQAPTHGFAIVARLRPDGDVGRVWSLTRPLTYRSLEQLTHAGYVAPVGEERGTAGPNRMVLTATRLAGPGSVVGHGLPSATCATSGANCCSSSCSPTSAGSTCTPC